MRIKLWFTHDNDFLSLDRTEFCSGSEESTLRTIRGRCAPGFLGLGTFVWTPAVRAVALLLVKAALGDSDGAQSRIYFAISGGAGSAAASLDYALSKGPLWLLDMFGVDASGRPLARRLFYRLNPGRRRGGTVTIGLNRVMLTGSSVEIFVNGDEANECHGVLYAILHELEGSLADDQHGGVEVGLRRTA